VACLITVDDYASVLALVRTGGAVGISYLILETRRPAGVIPLGLNLRQVSEKRGEPADPNELGDIHKSPSLRVWTRRPWTLRGTAGKFIATLNWRWPAPLGLAAAE